MYLRFLTSFEADFLHRPHCVTAVVGGSALTGGGRVRDDGELAMTLQLVQSAMHVSGRFRAPAFATDVADGVALVL